MRKKAVFINLKSVKLNNSFTHVFDVGDIYPSELRMLRSIALLEVLSRENSSADNDL